MEEWLEHFKEACLKLGVHKGDLLYVSSDITMLMYRMGREYGIKDKKAKNDFLNRFVDALQDMTGAEGTLMIPMFTWSFCRGADYDVRTTPGEVGALGNWILENRMDFKRTAHPLYSFMTAGKDADLLCGMNNKTAWGEDSPFGYLHRKGGKNLLFHVTMERCFTFTHYVEQCIGAPYRYMKDFRGTYVDADGNRSDRIYTMFVRDLEIDSKQVTPDDCLDRAGAAVSAEYDRHPLKLVDLKKAYPVIVDNYLHHNGDEWYDFGEYVIDWNAGQTHPDHILGDG